ncbi:MAG: hypothetical protein LUM44_09935 [Pyrinomonadaceae bacterium]|nr:hypothetical protein [Pyrinomonadaceae bacterium]
MSISQNPPVPCLTPSQNSILHPNFNPEDSEKDRAQKLKNFLVELSKQPEVTEYRSIIRKAADAIREKAFGISDRKVESKLTEAFEEYFNGENYIFVEMSDLIELTGLREKEIEPILTKMISKGVVETSQRRRWNEPGKHYNDLYRLKK